MPDETDITPGWNAITLGELIAAMHDAGLIVITGKPDVEYGLELNSWLDHRGIDPETPVPVWNEVAQAWEI